MKRIQKDPIRGIPLKLQEEECKRRMDFVPDVSTIKIEEIAVDDDTLEMLSTLNMSDLPELVKIDPVSVQPRVSDSIEALAYPKGGSKIILILE